MPACMPMHHVCAWCPQMPEVVLDSPELRLQMAVSCCVGAGSWTWAFWRNNWCSYLLNHSCSPQSAILNWLVLKCIAHSFLRRHGWLFSPLRQKWHGSLKVTLGRDGSMNCMPRLYFKRNKCWMLDCVIVSSFSGKHFCWLPWRVLWAAVLILLISK